MPSSNETKKPKSRYQQIVQLSIVGIAANVALAAFKGAVGIIAGSIAVILDAVNSLTDAFASIATIIGEKIANMHPTKKHPYGYGRVEYVTSILIAAMILAAGLVSLRESFMKVIHPSTPDYSLITLIVLVVAIVVKVVLAFVFIKRGHAINSQPLAASGIDALYDAILTFGTLVAALVCMFWNIDIDGWAGLVISLFVVKAGIDVLRDALNMIIGARPDADQVNGIRQCIENHEEVKGVYDLVIDSFGPVKSFASAHIEVPDSMCASEIYDLTRSITKELEENYDTIATLGIYALNPKGEFADMHSDLKDIVKKYPGVLQMHGFYVDEADKKVDFDLVFDFKTDVEQVKAQIIDDMTALYPDYAFSVITDYSYSG